MIEGSRVLTVLLYVEAVLEVHLAMVPNSKLDTATRIMISRKERRNKAMPVSVPYRSMRSDDILLLVGPCVSQTP